MLGGIGAAIGDPPPEKEPVAAAPDTTSGTAARPAESTVPTAPTVAATPTAESGAQPVETRAVDTVAVPKVVGQRLDAATAN